MVRNAGGRQAAGGVLDYRAPVHHGARIPSLRLRCRGVRATVLGV